MSNGKDMSDLIMTVIRFCVTVDDHELTKLLHIFWECAQKCDDKGELKPEMILVCNAIMNNLKHANEYIRGCTLRFLSKITEDEILEPLVPYIKENLEHHSAYVRKNAVLTCYSIYKLHGDRLMSDIPDYIYELLGNETDLSTRRNAFAFLMDCKQSLAIEFLENNCDEIGHFGDCFQLVALELIRKVCMEESSQKGRFIKPLQSMLNSDSPSVAFESATTLVTLSSAPSAVKAAANTLLSLLSSQTDNNVKIVILDRLSVIIRHNCRLLEDSVMELLALLRTPSTKIRSSLLELGALLVSDRSIAEVMNFLKSEVVRTASDSDELGREYRELLIQSIHALAVRFPAVADTVILLLLDYLNSDSGVSILSLVKEMLLHQSALVDSVLAKLFEVFSSLEKEDVILSALWIIAEFTPIASLPQAIQTILDAVGPLPLRQDVEVTPEASAAPASAPTVLQDGTYASQSYVATDAPAETSVLPLRHLLVEPSFFACSVLSNALAKLCIHLERSGAAGKQQVRDLKLQSLLVMTELLAEYENSMDELDRERIEFFVRALLDPAVGTLLHDQILKMSREVFEKMVAHSSKKEEKDLGLRPAHSDVDEVIVFKQLRDKSSLGIMIDIDDNAAVEKATEFDKEMTYNEKLNRVHQLTGYSDPVYCESVVYMKDFDIIMEITVINRTNRTMTDLAVELSVTGSFSIIDKPGRITLDAGERRELRAIIKVNSTETGYIFGSITFSYSSSAEHAVVNLNEVYVSLMEYIKPADCDSKAFRTMWSAFTWENKISVNTNLNSLAGLIQRIADVTHMKIVSDFDPETDADFMAANLYARSLFGEDILLNVSVEKTPMGVSGYYRIRSKTQGVAISLGDVIKMKQKNLWCVCSRTNRRENIRNIA